MEWPIIHLPGETISGIDNKNEFVMNLTTVMITKKIYSRAAMACISDITIDHIESGLQNKVNAYLNNLKNVDVENWDNNGNNNNNNNNYRLMAFEFLELMTYAASSSNNNDRIIEICLGGLDAVHDLFKYRLPTSTTTTSTSISSTTNDNNGTADTDTPAPAPSVDTILAVKDAYVLSQSLCSNNTKLDTNTLTGSRSPDIDYKFGLYNDEQAIAIADDSGVDINNDSNKLYGLNACKYITKLRTAGQIETSSSSLAKYTLMNKNIVSQLQNKISFIVFGCDHPLSPTKSLLRIPGVTVIGIPTSWIGLDDIIEYVQFNSPDDTTFIYPTGGGGNGGNSNGSDGNLIISHGPHIAQWILDNITRIMEKKTTSTSNSNSNSDEKHEFVLVPMMAPSQDESSVRYSAASDLIIQRILSTRSSSLSDSNCCKISIWMYQSSDTCMVVPSASTTHSKKLLSKRPYHESWIHTLSMDTVLTPTFVDKKENSTTDEQHNTATADVTGEKKKTQRHNNHDYAIVNGIISSHTGGGGGGSHHVLAEMIRMWRCLVINLSHNHPQHEYDDDDFDDDDDLDKDDNDYMNSSNNNVHVFAPYVPLLKNNNMVGSNGVSNIGVLEPTLKIFDINTASSLMTAIGLAGLCEPLVNRPMPTIDDGFSSDYNSTPFSIFWNGSVHGGIWNCPYTLDSTLSGYTGFILGKVYNYYDTYYYNNNAATAAAATVSAEVDAQQQNTNNDNNDIERNYSGSSKLGEPMPDCVRERLEIM